MNIKYSKPCPLNYDALNTRGDKKFCEQCQKSIYDFTNSSEEKIMETLQLNKGKEICGLVNKSILKSIAVSALMVSNLAFAELKQPSQGIEKTEKNWVERTVISGKLIQKTTGKTIANAVIYFVSKKYYAKTKTNENGEFSLEIPTEYLNNNNLLSIRFNEINKEIVENPKRTPPIVVDSDLLENTNIYFSKKELLKDKEIIVESKKHYLGGLSISLENPPRFYYVDGKSISQKKFAKLKTEHPEYQYFFFDETEAEIVANKSYLKSIELLFSY